MVYMGSAGELLRPTAQERKRKIGPKRKFWAGYPCEHPAKSFGLALQIDSSESPNSLGQESRSPKVPRIFRIFVPNFAPSFSPNFFPKFLRSFRASFRGEMETRKNSPKIPAIFKCKIPRQIRKKIFTKCFWRGGKVIIRADHFRALDLDPLLANRASAH